MSSDNQPPKSPLVDELATLGKNLGSALRTLLESPQRYEVEEEVREGFQTVVTEVNDALGKARSSDVAKDVGVKAEKVVESVKTSQVTAELREGLVRGLHSLNIELGHLAEHLNNEAEQTEAPVEAESAESAAEATPAETTDEETPIVTPPPPSPPEEEP
ncbi:MAG: hypothetical protein GY759_04555 [Chloroflexi bacterium]|nr:hypothetical protein [Chloroflexota bacterium]